MPVTAWVPPFAVAVMWTGDTTVAPLAGELTVTLCASAAVVKIVAAIMQHSRDLRVDLSWGGKLREDFKEPLSELSESKPADAVCKTNLPYAVRNDPNRNGW